MRRASGDAFYNSEETIADWLTAVSDGTVPAKIAAGHELKHKAATYVQSGRSGSRYTYTTNTSSS